VSAQPAVVSSPIAVTGYLDGITSQPSVVAQPLVVSSPIPMTGYLDGITSRAPAVPAVAASDEYVRSIGALG
jgi:hypothetical protein